MGVKEDKNPRALSGIPGGRGRAEGPALAPPSTSQQHHLPLQLDRTLGLLPSISSPFSWLPLLSSGADMTPIRIAEAALTKQLMSLSAIDSAALGQTATPRSSVPHQRQRKR